MTFKIVVVDAAIVELATVFAYNETFWIFSVEEDFDQTWRDHRHTSSGSFSKATSIVIGPGKDTVQFGIMTLMEAQELNLWIFFRVS